MSNPRLEKALAATGDALGDLIYKPLVIGGIALGWGRDKTPIAHDRDIDFALINASWCMSIREIVDRLKAAGARPLRMFFNNADELTEVTLQLAGVKVEFFRHFLSPGESVPIATWFAYSERGGQRVQLRRQMPMPGIAPKVVGDRLWLLPDPLDAYLTAQYGPDWRTPNPAWRYDRDCPANIETIPWTGRHGWDESRLIFND